MPKMVAPGCVALALALSGMFNVPRIKAQPQCDAVGPKPRPNAPMKLFRAGGAGDEAERVDEDDVRNGENRGQDLKRIP